MTNPTIVCVLGMHRSGTSLVARVLNLLGVYLGPEAHLVSPAADNPKGFWEHRPIMTLNQNILVRLKGNCYDPPAFAHQWENSSALDDLRVQALDVVRRDFATADLWGWKDPRTCLTLPFWQQVLPPMKYVFCLRNPVEVARSLERRDGLSFEKGIYLWLRYMKHALQHTTADQSIFLTYTDMLENWRRELRRLSVFLGEPERAAHLEVQNAVQNFIDKGLYHHRAPVSEAGHGDKLESRTQAICKAQRAYAEIKKDARVEQEPVALLVQEALDLIGPEIEAQGQKAYDGWKEQISLAMQEIENAIPPGNTFILADEDQWGMHEYLAGRHRIPFIERNGQYWGLPLDSKTAIREVERLQRAGATYFVFAWPAFPWFRYYPELHQYLDSKFRCILQSDRLLVFDLNY